MLSTRKCIVSPFDMILDILAVWERSDRGIIDLMMAMDMRT